MKKCKIYEIIEDLRNDFTVVQSFKSYFYFSKREAKKFMKDNKNHKILKSVNF